MNEAVRWWGRERGKGSENKQWNKGGGGREINENKQWHEVMGGGGRKSGWE